MNTQETSETVNKLQGRCPVKKQMAILNDTQAAKIAFRLADIEKHNPKRLQIFKKVYGGTASKSTCIKAKCFECSGWDVNEAKCCTVATCPLWQINPYRKGRKA